MGESPVAGTKLAFGFGVLYNVGMYKDPLDERARASRRLHYQNNKQQYIDRKLALQAEMRKVLDEIKDAPCMDCGVKYPPFVMDFDHRDPTQKVDGLARLVRSGSMRKMLAEVEKCDVVCSNCHRIRTFQNASLV